MIVFFSLNKLIIILVNMEVQTCAYTSPNVSNFNSNYGTINITSVIMCFLIIYSTALSIVLSVKQLIQIIKEENSLMKKRKKRKLSMELKFKRKQTKKIIKRKKKFYLPIIMLKNAH